MSVARWLTRQITETIRETNEAQRVAMALRLSPDMYLAHRDRAPDTYEEFLSRSPIPLRHERRAARRRPSRPSSTRSL